MISIIDCTVQVFLQIKNGRNSDRFNTLLEVKLFEKFTNQWYWSFFALCSINNTHNPKHEQANGNKDFKAKEEKEASDNIPNNPDQKQTKSLFYMIFNKVIVLSVC